MARVDLHRAGDGLEGAVPEVVEGLLVQVVLLLAEALLEELALVPELDHRLGVGVERGDGGGHAAGEGAPRHAGGKETEGMTTVCFLENQKRKTCNLSFYWSEWNKLDCAVVNRWRYWEVWHAFHFASL